VKNRLPGFSYNNAGDMTANGGVVYNYDAENRIKGTSGWTYKYDGDGQRVRKSNSGTNGTLYWRGAGSDTLLETSMSGAATEEYIFFNGKRVVRRDASNGAVHFYFSDHLGSASVVTSSTGVIQKESDYYPYGGELAVSGTDPNNYKFTGKERDAETALDYFGARYYSSAVGRFFEPDTKSFDLHFLPTPQKWNKYAYVINNPLSLTDPNGLEEQSFLQKLAGVFYVKGSVGVGLEVGARVQLGKAKSPFKLGGSIGADVKATGKLTTEGVTVSGTKEAGAKVDIGKLVLGPQTAQENVTVKNGQALSQHEVEQSASLGIGTEKAEATASKSEVGGGFEVDAAVLVVGFEGGIDTEKVGELYKETITNLQNAVDNILHPFPDSQKQDADNPNPDEK
jgi:RHS repeat-associated protein